MQSVYFEPRDDYWNDSFFFENKLDPLTWMSKDIFLGLEYKREPMETFPKLHGITQNKQAGRWCNITRRVGHKSRTMNTVLERPQKDQSIPSDVPLLLGAVFLFI